MANRDNVSTIFALLSSRRAVEVLREITSTEHSSDPLVRDIIDNKIGMAQLGRARPDDEIEERILAVHTTDLLKAWYTLARRPEVAKIAPSFSALTVR